MRYDGQEAVFVYASIRLSWIHSQKDWARNKDRYFLTYSFSFFALHGYVHTFDWNSNVT